MSRIATARKLAKAINAGMDALSPALAAELRDTCPIGTSLAYMIETGIVTGITEDAIDVLLRTEQVLGQLAARTVAPAATSGRLDLEAAGPIFAAGATVLVRHDEWQDSDSSETCLVKGARWDNEDGAWYYIFENAEFRFEVMEGDLSWEVELLKGSEI